MPTPDDNTGAPDVPAAAAPPPLTPLKSLLITVGEGISLLNPDVTADAAAVFVNRERKKRAEAIVAAKDTLDGLRREDNKIKPDVVSFNADKSIAAANWSQGQLKKKEDSVNKIKKYENALNKALGMGVYDDLYKIAKSSSAPSDDEDDKAA